MWSTKAECAVFKPKNVKCVDEMRKKIKKIDKKALTDLNKQIIISYVKRLRNKTIKLETNETLKNRF